MADVDQEILGLIVEGLPKRHAATVRNAVVKAMGANASNSKAVDHALFSDKAYVFHWDDVVGLADIVEAAKSVGGGGPASMVLLKRLLGIWIRLRTVRVELSRDETVVLLAVRRKPATLTELVAKTKLSENRLKTIVGAMMAKTYAGGKPILQRKRGRYLTDF